MDYHKSITISFSIRPFKMAVNALLLAATLLVACVPAPIANILPPAPVTILTAEQQHRKTQVDFVESELRGRVRGMDGDKVRLVAATLVDESRAARLDPLFVLAVIEAESNFDVEACSASKAKGLMQILPTTFAWLEAPGSLFNPVDNVRAGVRYLSHLSKSFHRPESILMAYNGGPSKTSKYLRAQAEGDEYPISHEMRSYPGKVMGNYKKLLVKTGQKPQQAHKLFKVSNTPILFVASR